MHIRNLTLEGFRGARGAQEWSKLEITLDHEGTSCCWKLAKARKGHSGKN